MSNLPYMLSALRKEQNLSQKDIAEHLNISRQAYARYEKGEREPNIDTLSNLARFFRVSLDYLIGFSLLESEDREIAKKLNISNAELIGRTLHQGAEIAVKKALKKEPNLFDKEIINEYKKLEQK